MNAVYDMLMAKRKALELYQQNQEHTKNRYEYDSDEDTEGGTWEHKSRVNEMIATKGKWISINFKKYFVQGNLDDCVDYILKISFISLIDWADKLTDMGRGKHHIGDFLPPQELEKFMETYTVRCLPSNLLVIDACWRCNDRSSLNLKLIHIVAGLLG